MLPKFYVREATTKRNSPYTFHEDGFYKTLQRKVIGGEILARLVGSNKHSVPKFTAFFCIVP
jgi:hypothetical protein